MEESFLVSFRPAPTSFRQIQNDARCRSVYVAARILAAADCCSSELTAESRQQTEEQLDRAASSVVLNLAEGIGRGTYGSLAHTTANSFELVD